MHIKFGRIYFQCACFLTLLWGSLNVSIIQRDAETHLQRELRQTPINKDMNWTKHWCERYQPNLVLVLSMISFIGLHRLLI